jgi:hypothetical protein
MMGIVNEHKYSGHNIRRKKNMTLKEYIHLGLKFISILGWTSGSNNTEFALIEKSYNDFLDSLKTSKFSPAKKGYQTFLDSLKIVLKDCKLHSTEKRFLKELYGMGLMIRRESNKQKNYGKVITMLASDFDSSHEIPKANFIVTKKKIKVSFPLSEKNKNIDLE